MYKTASYTQVSQLDWYAVYRMPAITVTNYLSITLPF